MLKKAEVQFVSKRVAKQFDSDLRAAQSAVRDAKTQTIGLI